MGGRDPAICGDYALLRNDGARRRGPLVQASPIEDEPRGPQNAGGYEDAKEDAAENHCEIIVFRRSVRFGVERSVHLDWPQ